NPGPDPWDARSLEWMVQSPVPAHNFDEVPTVSHLDEFWHRKYQENADGKVVRVATGAEAAQPGDATGVHLPSPSYWPLVLAAGLPLIGYGLIFNLGIAVAGALIVLLAGFGWGYEPADDPEAHHGPHGDGHGPGHDDGDAHAGGDGDGERDEDAPGPAGEVPAGVTVGAGGDPAEPGTGATGTATSATTATTATAATTATDASDEEGSSDG
ncbi:MAG TPA: cytochrome c oxidase subunit 4, partial [Acidimicrobiales bacterium]|nr:cytochrome c oxidase subunit 4 [Acidimicrobiales bacterium]